MSDKTKPSAGGKPVRTGPKIDRTSDSGKFVVADQATRSDRFSSADLKKAVRKVIASHKGASRS